MPYQLDYPRRSNPVQPFKRFRNSTNQDFLSVISGGIPFYDLIWETAAAPNTGNVTLGGAPSGTPYQTFGSVMSNGQLTLYRIGDSNGNFEVGFGVWLTGGTLVRQQVDQSSNSDQLVNFTSSVNVIQPAPADWSNWVDTTTRANQQAVSTLQQQLTGIGNPPGTVIAFAASYTPVGYLYCDGSAISRTTYAALFGVIGTVWGSGNGSTTFNLPDLRDRVLISTSPGSLSGNRPTAQTVGSTGGEETHTLTLTEIPSHSHNMNTGASDASSGGSGIANTDTSLSVPINTDPAGGGGAHNNLQPYAVIQWVIKT